MNPFAAAFRHSRWLHLAAVLFGAQSLVHAVPFASWEVDRLSGFRLEISGTLVGDSMQAGPEWGEYTSPSGLWTIYYSGGDFTLEDGQLIELGPIVDLSFHGFHPFTAVTPPYIDVGGGSSESFEFPGGSWAGLSSIQISGEDSAGLNTWTYLVTITLDTPAEYVPDSGYTCSLLAMALGALALARHRFGKKRHW